MESFRCRRCDFIVWTEGGVPAACPNCGAATARELRCPRCHVSVGFDDAPPTCCPACDFVPTPRAEASAAPRLFPKKPELPAPPEARRPEPEPRAPPAPASREEWVAMMLSAVVPGGGQFYSKTYVAGITWMSAVVLAAVVTLLAARTEFLAGLGAMGLLLMVWVNNVRDARDCAVASVRRARSKS